MKKIFILISTICVLLLAVTLAINIYFIFFPQKNSVPVMEKNIPEEGIAPETIVPEVAIPEIETPSAEAPIIPVNEEPSFRTPANADPNSFYIQ